MIKVNNLYKIYESPVNEINVLQKLFLGKKNKELERKTQFFALQDVSFEINTNEKVFVLGDTASGKSTLYSILAKKIDYDSGKVEMSNNFFSTSFIRIPPNLVPGLKIKNYIKTLLSFYLKTNIEEISKVTEKILELLLISKSDEDKYFYEYESAFFSKLVVAISCFSKSKIYLYDNFYFSSKNANFCNLLDFNFQQNQKATYIFFGCKDVDLIKKYSTKVLVLKNGLLDKYSFTENFTDTELTDLINKNKIAEELIEEDDI